MGPTPLHPPLNHTASVSPLGNDLETRRVIVVLHRLVHAREPPILVAVVVRRKRQGEPDREIRHARIGSEQCRRGTLFHRRIVQRRRCNVTLVVCSACSTMRKPVAGNPRGNWWRRAATGTVLAVGAYDLQQTGGRPHRVGDAVVPIDVMPVVDPFPAGLWRPVDSPGHSAIPPRWADDRLDPPAG